MGGGGGEILNKVYTERLDPEVQPFIILPFYLLIFKIKGAPFRIPSIGKWYLLQLCIPFSCCF